MPKFNDTTIYGDLTVNGSIKGSYAAGDILYASDANTLTRLPKGSDGQVLKLANGLPAWGTDNNDNTNTYPTTFTWSDGYTEGPTGTLTGTSQTVYFGPIPEAKDYQSGIVTVDDQTFAGTKTFINTISGSITGNAGSATKLATARTIFGQNFNGTGNVTGNITFGTQSNKATIAYTTNATRTFTIPNTTSNAEFVMELSWSTETGELILA